MYVYIVVLCTGDFCYCVVLSHGDYTEEEVFFESELESVSKKKKKWNPRCLVHLLCTYLHVGTRLTLSTQRFCTRLILYFMDRFLHLPTCRSLSWQIYRVRVKSIYFLVLVYNFHYESIYVPNLLLNQPPPLISVDIFFVNLSTKKKLANSWRFFFLYNDILYTFIVLYIDFIWIFKGCYSCYIFLPM